MLPYWLLFSLVAFPALMIRGHADERASKWGAAVVAVIIALFLGLRYEISSDWIPYLEIFEEARYLPLSEMAKADPAFVLIDKVVIWLGLDYWAVNLACAAIFAFGLFRFSFKMPNPWLALVVAVPYFVIVVAMGYTRQGVAIALVMVGLTAVAEQSFARFIMWTLLAAAFHKSAMIVLPIVGFSYAKNRMLVVLSAGVFTVIGYYVFVASMIDVLVTNYVDTTYESQGATVRVFMNAVPAFIYLLTMKRHPIPTSERKMWRNFAILSLVSVAAVIQFQSTTVIDRLSLYLIPLQLFVFSWLPSIFSEKGEPDRKLVLVVALYSGIVLYIWLNYASHAEYWVPYKMWPLFESRYY